MERTETRKFTGWGRTNPSFAYPIAAGSVAELRAALSNPNSRGLIVRGLGRSYGDAAQNAGGLVIDLTLQQPEIELDQTNDIVLVSAGVSLDLLLQKLLPLGYWVPVLPGTRQVTIGGAVACDVHGKNHLNAGSFGNYLTEITLLVASGDILVLTPQGDHSDLFWATVGGMGLTGVILKVKLRLARVETGYFTVQTSKATQLSELLAELSTTANSFPYSVAWIDSTKTQKHQGRGVVTAGRSAKVSELPTNLSSEPLRFAAPGLGQLPEIFPGGLINRRTSRVFNELWYRKATARKATEVQNLSQFFHPLDALADWNRVYGPRGFCQYQFLVPESESWVLSAALTKLAEFGLGSCLTVLKLCGNSNPGLLSFPAPGWTMTLDLPNIPKLTTLLAQLDAFVLAAKGRIYLAKDARLPKHNLLQMYPNLPKFQQLKLSYDPDRKFVSDLSRRLEI